ncbi:MOSC domain-containing protein [Novosphingopyxis iocasae]|uniref:MOSC domain-containing protein n=1 Tax=Novosphingopyxis iocasae TaxID=2762729 RepID=UPI0016513E89|nr:MOSC domain-containing protein [Novosphingopyxis iocasae]
MQSKVEGLFIGTPKPFRGDSASAIARDPVEGPVELGWTGFEGDQVADPVHHGGWDKAVHLYPSDHYPFWRKKLPDHDRLRRFGAFGENITAPGFAEHEVKIGDRFRMGDALVEISHGRQPCWKLDHHFGRPDMMATIVNTGRSGLYLRVIEQAAVAAGDAIERTERPDHDWTVARAFALLIQPGKRDPGALKDLAQLETLAEAWRQRARGLAGG